MKRQFVSTCYIIHEEKFLLLLHPKHKKWVAPGGHLEENETPPEAARREVREETGLEIEFIRQENLWIQEWNAVSIERPFTVLLEQVPGREHEPAHEHIDFIYIARPTGGNLTDGRWLSLQEIEGLKTHVDTFFDTQATIRKIYENLYTKSMKNREFDKAAP